jgi:integrase
MAIKSYINENGETRFKVYINMRSKLKTNLRAQRKANGIKTLKDAESEQKRLIRECERELQRQEVAGETWGSVVEAWEQHLLTEKEAEVNSVTRTDYIACLRKHTFDWWKRPAATLSRADVKEVLNQLKANGRSKSGQNVVKVIINRAFGYGIDSGMLKGLERSPTYGISLGRREEAIPEILNLSQIKSLLSRAREFRHPWYPVWAVALLTGMRNGELNALLWSDIDWDGKHLWVTKSYNTRTRKVKTTKSGEWRMVPISSELMAILKMLKVDSAGREPVLPRLTGWEKGIQAKELRKFLVLAKLPSVKFHTLRACFATQLIRNGVPPIQLQKICGWKDLETMERYIRLAGIDSIGVTEVLQVLPDTDILDQVSRDLAERCPVMDRDKNTVASSWLFNHPTT